jgi:hemoglobin-like flavoprotein
MLADRQIALVQETFRKVQPIADQAAALFYGRLFEIDPSTRALFRTTDMTEQGRKLMAAIGMVVASLRGMERIMPALAALGAKHAGYGVTPAQYETVGAALLWTLRQGLGTAFTKEVEQAWAAAYGAVAQAMQAGEAALAEAA